MPTPASPAVATDQSAFGGATAAQAAATNTALGLKPIVPTYQVPTDRNTPGTPTYSPTGFAKTPAVEPTVVTNTNIPDNVIPQLNSKLAAVSQKGTVVGPNGSTLYADGSAVPAPVDSEFDPATNTWNSNGTSYSAAPQYVDNPSNDPEIAKTNELLGSLKSSLDASTLSQVNNIETQYGMLRSSQETANGNADDALAAASLRAGTTRFAPLNAISTALATTNSGLQKIQKLDADEDSAIASVKTAQQNGNYQLMEKALDTVDSIRTSKQAAAQKLQDTLSAANDAAAKQQEQVQQDTAVGQLVSQGITDPAAVLKAMNDAGYSVTADQVSSSLKNLTTTATAGGTYKFSNTDVGKLLGSGLSMPQIQAAQDYYNGKGDSNALTGLSAAQQQAVQTALVGKAAATGSSKTLTSGSLKYTADDISEGAQKLQASKGSDGYVDPNVYLNLAQAWTSNGGSIKDFIKAYPVSSWVNPANTFVTPQINALVKQDAAGTKTTGTTDISTEIDNLFANNPS